MKERMEIKNLDDLYEAILHLETVEECRSFFKDLCTIPELKALSQRFQVAKMLIDDNVYSEIVRKTGASTATISRAATAMATLRTARSWPGAATSPSSASPMR